MPRTIAQRELRNDNAKIIAAVQAGETFIVTKNGVPVAELRPVHPGKRKFVPKEDIIAAFKDLPPIDYEQFRRDIYEGVDVTLRDPWEK